MQQFHKSALGQVHFITWFLIILKIAMFCVTASIILSSKYRCIFLLFVLEFVMNHKNETGNITTEKSFSTEAEKLVRASYENNWKIDVEPLSFVYWAHPPPPPSPDRWQANKSPWWSLMILHLLYCYMRNFCNLIGLEQWYFSLIWNTYMWKLQILCGQ